MLNNVDVKTMVWCIQNQNPPPPIIRSETVSLVLQLLEDLTVSACSVFQTESSKSFSASWSS